MLKKLFLATALSASVALAGCATTSTTPTTGGTTTDANVAAVIAAVKTGCSYVAPASQVASIITTFTGGGGIVDLIGTVANSICGAVTAKGAMRGAAQPQVNGVVLTGHFISGARKPR
jgi:hypothetical protein